MLITDAKNLMLFWPFNEIYENTLREKYKKKSKSFKSDLEATCIRLGVALLFFTNSFSNFVSSAISSF